MSPVTFDLQMRPARNLQRQQTVTVGVPTKTTGGDGKVRAPDVATSVPNCELQSLSGVMPTILAEGGERLIATHYLFGPLVSAFQVGRIVTDAAGQRYRIQAVSEWVDHVQCLLWEMR